MKMLLEKQGQNSPAEIIDRLVKSCKVIDLTVTLGAEYPTSPIWGVPFIKAPFNYFTSPQTDMRGRYMDFVLVFEEHCGTHFDSPAHGIPHPDSGLPDAAEIGRTTVEKVPISQLMGPAAVIDCTDLVGTAGPGKSPVITVSKIQDWEKHHGEINQGDVVILYTGWTDRFYKKFPEGYGLDRDCKLYKQTEGWASPEAAVMKYLLKKGVMHVAIDTVSMGLIQNDEEPHRAGLEAGMVFTEKLCNLGLLPPRGAYFMFLPIKVEGGSAAPGRAIAIC
jgi:kynurenine formamidase